MVPEAGIEPVREKISRDFKSRASANSAIPAYGLPCCHIIIAQVVGFVKPFLWDFSFFRFPAGYLRLSSWHKRKNMIFYIRTCTCSICTFWANMCDVRSRKYAGLSKWSQRGGLENLSVKRKTKRWNPLISLTISPLQKSQNYQHLTQYLTLSKFTI